jgi:outer membrane immunogenic protein
MKRLVGIAALASVLAATSAWAADLPARVYTKAPVIPPVIYDWTGFYVGGNVGGSWGREHDDGNLTGTQNIFEYRTASGPPVLPTSTAAIGPVPLYGRSNVNGVIGGGQAGYNWQLGTWLLGLEGDFQGSGERSNGAICTVAGCPAGSVLYNTSYRLDWFGTFRGRAGFLVAPQFLLYATGGLAYGHLSATEPTVPLSWGGTRAGWTVGAGGEWAIDSHWSIKAEYLYMDLGGFGNASASTTTSVTVANVPRAGFSTLTVTNTTAAFNTHFTDNIVRVGVNYRFGGPVVAKY